MKVINLKILSLIFIILCSKVNSQVTEIFNSNSRTINATYKNLLPTNDESFYIELSPADAYSGEQIFRYNFLNNNFYIPHSGFITPSCMVNPPGVDCGSLIEFQSSRSDTNIILNAMIDPWWEPAGSIGLTENSGGSARVLLSNGFIFNSSECLLIRTTIRSFMPDGDF